jgi:hemerythrin
MARDALTPKQERFAQLVVIHGKKQKVAYRKAFENTTMSDADVDTQASHLMRHPKVAARVEQLRAMAEAKIEATVMNIGKALARIAFLDLRDCFDDNGNLLPPHELPEGVAVALDGIDVVENTNTVSVSKAGEVASNEVEYTKKVRFSRVKALEMLGKWKKMFVEQIEHGAPGDFSNMTDAELDEQHKAFTEAAKVIERARKSPKVLVPKPARA